VIAKLIKGSGFRGALAYLLDGPKGTKRAGARIVGGNMAGNDARQLAREFGALRKLRPSLGKAVCHASLSLAPEDRSIDDRELAYIAQRFMVAMGFQECPFVVVRHEDTKHQHIHIVASRITTGGQVVSDSRDYERAEKALRELEAMYLLHSPSQSLNTRKAGTHAASKQQPNGGNTMKNELRAAIDEAVRAGNGIKGLWTTCEARGVKPVPYISGKRVCGFAFVKDGVRVKGSSLGPLYTWNALRQRFDYDEAEDFPILMALTGEAAEPLACVVCPDIEGPQAIREQARRTLDDEYASRLAEKFGDDAAECKRVGRVLEINFRSGGRLMDYGYRVECDDTQPERSARRMVAIALAKGWRSVSFSGGEKFLREAMREAIAAGVQVVPADAWQKAIQDEVTLALSACAEVAEGPRSLDAVAARMQALRGGYTHEQDETPTHRPRRPTM
jgi:hypothetical protein